MAVLRLFAGVTEVAGVDQIEVDVSTVGGLVAEADGRFGSDFVRARSGARLWLNDDTEIEDLATPIGRTDVVAIIPPVSGGDDSKATARSAKATGSAAATKATRKSSATTKPKRAAETKGRAAKR
ncbi:MAG: MoaD/ThiS family protein [Acidimicrobiia bacterium]|nr:MoaD/ThiS family protein [Acidimicrobiia bacterium]